jgi:hypothetical protein
MTTSGVTQTGVTGDDIVAQAFGFIRVTQKGQTLDDDDERYGRELLNGIVKNWQRDGLHLWKDKEAALFLNVGQRYYDVSGTAQLTGATTVATSGDWVSMTLTANAVATDMTITVESITPLGYSGQTFTIAEFDRVGVVNNNGAIEWFVVSVDPTGSTITLDLPLTVDADSGNTVYVYRELATKPLKIYQENVRLWQGPTAYELPLYLLAYTEYNMLPQKNIQGTVVQAFYSPEIDSSRITIWPTSDTSENVLLFRYQSPLEIFDTQADTPDFPQEWQRPLAWALASELGPSYGIPAPRQAQIDARAASLYDSVLDWDQDNSSIFLQPRSWGIGGIGQ